MAGPRLADAWSRAGTPPRPTAAADAHPVWARVAERAEPPGARDTVRDAPDQPTAFSYRTPEEVLRRLPEPAAALLRRLDEAATEARDRTVAITSHINAALDRLAVRRTDLAATLRAARQHRLETVEDARRVLATPPTSRDWGPAERSHAEAIVRAADRAAEVEAEITRLREKLREHNARAAPILALRTRLAEAAARLRPPVRELTLPEVPSAKAEAVLRQARREIEAARAEIERVETAAPHPDDAPQAAAEAVARLAERTGPHRFVKANAGAITLREPHPAHHAEDDPPVSPLALMASIVPEAVTAWVLSATPTDPAAPRVADRPRLLAELRQRLREAEIVERAALRAMGDPLDAFRPDADPAIALCVETAR